MKRFIIISMTTVLTCFIVSCYYDNEEALYPQLSTSCDTTNVTFSGTITSMLKDYCYLCHSNNNASAYGNNIRLQDYVDVASLNAHISATIKHEPPHSPMPKNGGKLSDCLINQFDIWVKNGMPNN